MKKNLTNSKYEIVNELPANAVTFADYAKGNGYTTNYLYNLINKNKYEDKFKVVVFNTFNFIIPK